MMSRAVMTGENVDACLEQCRNKGLFIPKDKMFFQSHFVHTLRFF